MKIHSWDSALCSIFIFLAFNVTAFFCPYATNLRCQFCWYCLSKNQRGGFFVGLYLYFVGLCQIKCTIWGFKYHCLAILWYYPIRSATLPSSLTPFSLLRHKILIIEHLNKCSWTLAVQRVQHNLNKSLT